MASEEGKIRKAAASFAYFPDYTEEELRPYRQLIHANHNIWFGHQGAELVSMTIFQDEGYNTRIIPDRPYRGHGPICLDGGSPLVCRSTWYVELDVVGSLDVQCAGCQVEDDIEQMPRFHLRCSLAHIDTHIRVKKFKISTLDGQWRMEFDGEDMKLVSTGPEMLDSYYTMNTSSIGQSSALICLPHEAWAAHPIFCGETGLRLDIWVVPALKEADIMRIALREQQKFLDPQSYMGMHILTERYRQMVRDPEAGNFTLNLDNGVKLRCEKKILVVSSDYFDALMKHNRDAPSNEARINRFSVDAVAEFLVFAYTGEAPHVGKYAEEIVELADMYQVRGLKEKAERCLIRRLNRSNCIKMLNLAFTYNCRRLSGPAFIMFKAFAYELSQEDGFWEFSRNFIQELGMLQFFWFEPNFGNVQTVNRHA
ncbi:hypothetical protein BV898_05734 [Hypsibius exemplaris]|uniref:BTB domain-containing protein n=1 Tax=Hypsibius exemplaris TaxID=2072580 RepID=A0A1W0WYA0_HYPEX|nr:hypothetical protein BV898_05734 [Hypsibius exemplaris]